MSKIPSHEDLQLITEALEKYELPTITGAALGMLVRSVAPNLDIRAAVDLPVGTGALASFVEKFLPHLLQKTGQTGKDGRGGDNVYQVINVESTSSDQMPVSEAEPKEDYWNAFVRPTDPRELLAVKRSGVYALAFHADSDTESNVNVGKVTPDDFKAITDDFLSLLESSRDTSSVASRLRESKSYAQYVQMLKEAGSAFHVRWATHRRERVRQLFLSRLEARDVSLPDQQRLLDLLDQSQEAAHKEIKSAGFTRAALAMSPPTAPLHQADAESVLQSRELLVAIVSRMSTQEIRSLSLPFGHVLDALQSIGSKK